MELARQALAAEPRADHAVLYLLQAAARSEWQGTPESLVPPDLAGTPYADLGIAEFVRRRGTPNWVQLVLELSRKHPDVPDFKQVRAIAVLALATESGDFLPGGLSPVTIGDVTQAAADMKEVAEHYLRNGFSNYHDLVAHLNNAAVLLQLAGRQDESLALLSDGLQKVDDPQLRRTLALNQAARGNTTDALETLAGQEDFENRLLTVELLARSNPKAALERALALNTANIDARLAWLRWRLIGELSLETRTEESFHNAIAGLHETDPRGVEADLLQINWDKKMGLEERVVHERLKDISSKVTADAEMATRYLVAAELRNQGLPAEASDLLEGYVDLTRVNPSAILYLQSLAAARRDDKFSEMLVKAGSELRNAPEILRTTATHAWNMGDLARARAAVDYLLTREPENASGRLLKIEILLRQNQSGELLAELDQPIERLSFRSLKDRFRIASLLAHFGYGDRAAEFAYRLFLENRDKSQAWMTLSAVVLAEGWGEDESKRWEAPIVAANVAVDLEYEDGEKRFLVIEPDAELRRLDDESWEPAHPLVKELMGLHGRDRFSHAGRSGTVVQLRHKYVARLHYVMEHHEARFPEIFGFRRVPVDVEQPGGLDTLLAELKGRQDWIKEEQDKYLNSPWPIGVLAHRVGLDTIEVAAGLASQGLTLKVALGKQSERAAATAAVLENDRKGCVLDLLAFWTAWRLESLDPIDETCGAVHLPQSVLDRLLARREQIEFHVKDGLRSGRYESGKLAMTHVAAEVVRDWLDDLDRALAWVDANASVCPLVIGDDLPPALRDHLRTGRTDLFDGLALAIQRDILLVTDDLPTRDFGRILEFDKSVWLHQVFAIALDQQRIDIDTYIRWSANLIDASHNYIGVSGPVLARAARMDAENGDVPGQLFKALSRVVGGRNADPESHIRAVIHCLRDIWSDPLAMTFRQPVTGILLRQFVRERQNDYAPMLRTVLTHVSDMPDLVRYMHAWVRGHFLPVETLQRQS
jgi:predicted Zn-dependent protease